MKDDISDYSQSEFFNWLIEFVLTITLLNKNISMQFYISKK